MTCETTVYGWRIRPARRALSLEITVRPPRDVSVQELARALIHACPRDPDESSGRPGWRNGQHHTHPDAVGLTATLAQLSLFAAAPARSSPRSAKGRCARATPKGVIQQRVVARTGGL